MKRLATILVTSVTLTTLFLSARTATARELHVTTTIQAAVDAAHPGDTILVPHGTYRENVVVTKNHLSIEGAAGAVLDGAGLPEGTGIHVWPGAKGSLVKDFQLSGLRIQNFSENGVLLEQTSDFRVRRGRYAGNGEYGIFALHSSAGLIEDNDVSGSNDTGIYVGQSADVSVLENVSRDCTVGIEVENSSRILVRDNLATGNSVGILVDVLPGKDVTATEDVVVAENLLVGNNRPNPATDPTDILSRLPSGVGLLNVGCATTARGSSSPSSRPTRPPSIPASIPSRIATRFEATSRCRTEIIPTPSFSKSDSREPT
jgi:parallel beta-helix repeat protein